MHFHRGTLVLLMLLPASQFLGFIDPMAIAIKGAFDIHALILVLILFALLSSTRSWGEVRGTVLVKPILIFGVIWLYGVIYPVVAGYSTLFYAIKASKEFLTIFTYFAVFLYVRTEKEIKFCWNVLLGLGLYYSFIEMVAQIMGPALLSHMVYAFRKEMLFWKIYPPFWPVILIAFLHSYYEHVLAARTSIIRMSVSSIGLLLTFFRSYLLGTFVAVPILMLLSRQGIMRTIMQGAVISIVIISALVSIAFTAGNGQDSVERLSDEFILSGVEEFGSQTGGALDGREVFAKGRREIIDKNPYTGYGFIDKDSAYGRIVIKHITGDLLGFIDKGDVDTALKFGYLGRAILYGAAFYLVYLLIRIVRERITVSISVRSLTAATMVTVFLVVQPVHAALTYSFSLLPLGIVLGLIERERKIYLSKQRDRS